MADYLHVHVRDWSAITQKYDRMIKGTILHVFQIFIYISETIAALNLKLGMVLLLSSYYTLARNSGPHPLPMWGVSARVDHIRKSPFYVSLVAAQCSEQEAYCSF